MARQLIVHLPREIWVWILALGALAWIDPSAPALVDFADNYKDLAFKYNKRQADEVSALVLG